MNILVASSNIFRRELSSYILSEAGYHVLEAENDMMLLQCLNDTQPSLLVVDGKMLESPNSDLIDYISHHQSIRVMVLMNGSTGSSTCSPSPTQAMPVASAETLSWPYQAEEFLNHVDALLNRQSAAA